MADHMWWAIILVSVCFFILLLGILSAIGVLIYTVFEIRKAAAALNATLKSTEERLNPVLVETEQFLRSVRKITDDVGAATDAARNIAESGNEIVSNLKAISGLLNALGEGLSLRAFGIKAGVKTALDVLIDQIKNRR
ncbi:MAG: DUF948 domain-containing protein [Nitrospirae bacterium]|nr:DUF948 domain-containing protein [Nitrospirota bacterium]